MCPGIQHVLRAVSTQPILQTNLHSLLIHELIRQLLQQIAGPMTRTLLGTHRCRLDATLKESHLAIQVILLTPADEILYLRLPSEPVSHVKQARLKITYHIATEGEILVNTVLRQTGKLGILILQLLGKLKSLRTIHQTACLAEILYVRLQLLSERIVVCAINGNIFTDETLRDGAEIDTADRTIRQNLRFLCTVIQKKGTR